MKEIFRPILMLWVKSGIAFALSKPFIVLFKFISRERRTYLENPDQNAIKKIVEKKLVLAGPFKGLEYPSVKAFGSAIYPKLIGSYESFLNPVVENIINQGFSDVIQIGSAEGYFTVGLGTRLKDARIISYEIDDQARSYQEQLASKNKVNNIIMEKLCTPETLRDISFERKGLVICDCEGCEMTMFNEVNKENLKDWYLIIETHSMINLSIPEKLKEHFSDSHDLKVILSEDDNVKAGNYVIPEIENLDIATRKMLVSEHRENQQEFLILSPKGAQAI